MNRSPLALALLLTTTCSGCYSTWDIAPSEMKKLDGYRAPLGRMVHDKAGADVLVDTSTELSLKASATIAEVHAKFDSIDVSADPPTYLSGTRHGDHLHLWVNLDQVGHVTAKRFSESKTTALVFGVLAATAVTVGLTYLAVKSSISDH